MVKRRGFLGALLLTPIMAAAARLMRGGRSGGGSGDIPSANALPSGALSFTVTWDAVDGASGYVVYAATSTQSTPDPSLYAYRYLVSGGSTVSLVVGSVASGTKYVRVAAHDGTWVGDLSHEVTYTPA